MRTYLAITSVEGIPNSKVKEPSLHYFCEIVIQLREELGDDFCTQIKAELRANLFLIGHAINSGEDLVDVADSLNQEMYEIAEIIYGDGADKFEKTIEAMIYDNLAFVFELRGTYNEKVLLIREWIEVFGCGLVVAQKDDAEKLCFNVVIERFAFLSGSLRNSNFNSLVEDQVVYLEGRN